MKFLAKSLKILLIGFGTLALLVSISFGYADIPLTDLKEKYAPPPSAFVSVDGMEVHFRDEGRSSDSIPLVLIHGTGASLQTFDGWTSTLSKDRRVIRMDLPGYGLTGPFPDRDYSIENYVSFLKHFLDSVGIETCVLGGNSLGGGIAWRFTSKYPEMVDRLILIDASGYPDEAESLPIAFEVAKIPIVKNLFKFITPRLVARSSLENVYSDKTKVTDELVDRYFDLTLREGNREAFVDRFEAKKDTTAYRKIKEITQPTLVLWGKDDRLKPIASAYRFHSDLPNDTLVILPNLGHVPMEEDPEESVKPVLTFVKY
ncbi:MAG: pimeloyl-ACP methyl ester carboxylesterase [Cryomorphaceae bacterium]|jgi:pimeloyl-ACP methyl ester carboxylesterase